MKSLLEYHSKHRPNKIAILDSREKVTWSELSAIANRAASSWVKTDCQSKDSAILFLKNDLDSMIFLTSALTAGLRIVLLDPDMQISVWQERIRPFLCSKIVIGSPETLTRLNLSGVGLTPKEALEGKRSRIFDSSVHDGSGALLFLTSGSTGTPKLVCRDTPALCAEGLSYVETLNLTDSDVVLAGLPLFHSFTCGAAFFSMVQAGGTLALINKFYPRHICDAVNKHGVTFLPMVPSVAKLMVDTLPERTLLSSLRIAMVGAGRLLPTIAENFTRKFGVQVTGNYGSTETGALVVRSLALSDPDPQTGTPMRGVKISILDEGGKNIENGKKGEIAVQTAALFSGYFGEALSPRLSGRLWLTGDYGYLTRDDVLYILGRKDQVVRRNGRSIYPWYLEDTLMKHDGISEAVVVGISQPETLDHLVIAFIVLKGQCLSTSELIDFCAESIGRQMLPDDIVIVNNLPRSPVGKILRGELRANYEKN